MYQPSSPSRRSGASPAVVVTLCEKQNMKSAGNSGGSVVRSVSQTTVESGETRHSPEIVDKSAILGGGRSKLQWIKSPGMYKVSTALSWGLFLINYSELTSA